MQASDSKHDAVEVAARPLRDLLMEEHDTIAAAQRALRDEERRHDLAVGLAERQLKAARTAEPLDSYGHEVVLYADRLSTSEGNHELTSDVRARVETSPGHRARLVIEASGWRSEVSFPRRDHRKVIRLAKEIEAAALNADAVRGAGEADARQAEQDLGGAQARREAIAEVRRLMHRLGELLEEGEDVIDMAPGVSAGHDGVLVATDRRVLFVGLRRTLAFPYEDISRVAVKGKWFGSRLALSTTEGTGVISGVSPQHAADIAALVEGHLTPG